MGIGGVEVRTTRRCLGLEALSLEKGERKEDRRAQGEDTVILVPSQEGSGRTEEVKHQGKDRESLSWSPTLFLTFPMAHTSQAKEKDINKSAASLPS